MLLNPAEYAIRTFGGVRSLAATISRSPGTVSFWRKSGFIPSRNQRDILMAARRRHLDLNAEDIILGRKLNEEQK